MSGLRIVITGSSGFIGRRLLDGLKHEYTIMGLARRSQLRCGAPFHENISWVQVDIGDREALKVAFEAIRAWGGADIVIHLAAHYDFTGDDHPEYWRTNVDGLRNVLEECRSLDLKRFIFASSVAACAFPPRGETLTEDSPPDGDHIYAITKRIGEEMLADFDDSFPSCIVRFAALFSDWCEYPPLYFFLETWLSRVWNAKVLGGKGLSAIPYMHVRDLVPFFRRLLDRDAIVAQREVLIASPSSTLNHLQLFELAHLNDSGTQRRPLLMPGPLCRVGVWGRDLLGRILGNRPFERSWMVKYIDRDLAVDASYTQQRLDWRPRERLLLDRRMAFLVEHRKTDPDEWHRRNRAAMKDVQIRANLRVHRLLEKHHDEIRERFVTALLGPDSVASFPSYQSVSKEILEWRFTVVLRHLLNSVRTEEKGIFTAYCRDLASKRFDDGFDYCEVCRALEALNHICMEVLAADPEGDNLSQDLRNYVSMTIQFGCDQIMESYEELGGEFSVVEE